jgi:hypothetical protein
MRLLFMLLHWVLNRCTMLLWLLLRLLIWMLYRCTILLLLLQLLRYLSDIHVTSNMATGTIVRNISTVVTKNINSSSSIMHRYSNIRSSIHMRASTVIRISSSYVESFEVNV